ncbi:unnamed protein product [Macrosiphum euphorbiae]|uniref:Uncharacterized protein n=1 Tax=Macrosiphum euphorbiae TaxID=13131 RepID=A0AAV0VKG5_9HEMI|nr:unnamed protein product [Macrosiphum euphorbiae]
MLEQTTRPRRNKQRAAVSRLTPSRWASIWSTRSRLPLFTGNWKVPLPPHRAGPSVSVDRPLVLIPGNVFDAPEVPPPSDDRTRRDETVPELPTVPAARSGRAELEPDRQRRKPGSGRRGRPRGQI